MAEKFQTKTLTIFLHADRISAPYSPLWDYIYTEVDLPGPVSLAVSHNLHCFPVLLSGVMIADEPLHVRRVWCRCRKGLISRNANKKLAEAIQKAKKASRL